MAIAGPGWALVTRDSGSEQTAVIERGDSPEEVAAALEKNEEQRNRTETKSLTDSAAAALEKLNPVMTGLAAALPVTPGATARAPEPSAVAEWREVTDEVLATFDEEPFAGDDVTQAWSGVRASIGEVGSAVIAYEAALSATGEERARLETLAATLRDRAVDVWATASVNLDEANIAYGGGHRHVQLQRDPGSPVEDVVEPEVSEPDTSGNG